MDHMVPYGHTMNPICAIGEPQVLMWAVWVHILSMWAHIGIMCAYRSRTLDSHKAKCVPISGPDVPLPVHMSSTWEHIGPNAGLYGPTWAPSRPNIDPHGTPSAAAVGELTPLPPRSSSSPRGCCWLTSPSSSSISDARVG